MSHKPIEFNVFNDLLNIIMSLCIPISIFNLGFASSTAMTIIHSLLLMYFTSVLTVKVFAWKVRNDQH